MGHDETTESASPPDPPPRPSPGERPGEMIGPYRLLEILGEGGFGVVWLAERREPMVQRVALKIIKPGMDSKAVVARFEQERQALAVMDHPNVASVYDAGTTPAGRPFFVMEFVKGSPITDFCDRHNLTIRQRLEIFIPVCEAVQHAHMKGLIHRDIKPTNILVSFVEGLEGPRTEHGRGAQGIVATALVKVIDFGVAKAISHTLTDKTIFTEHGQIIGTPEYMSPEQAEMGIVDIDTRTDVYSLGVVLYEVLAGALPFDRKTLRAKGYNEIQRIIRDVDPPKPSTKLTSLARMAEGIPTASAEIARHRQVRLDDLVQELRRELDWVPLKAMRKDRRERYRTPADMADDIRNYLSGQPLSARPESASYRVRKFVRRNRGPVIATLAILGILVLGVVGTTWGLVSAVRAARRASIEAANTERARLREAEQRDAAQRNEALAKEQAALAEQEAQVARAERDRAERIASFTTGFLAEGVAGVGPSVALGRDTSMLRTMMDAVAKRIVDGGLRDVPEVELGLRLSIGKTYRQIAIFDMAGSMLRPALDLARALPERDPLVEATCSHEMAQLLLDTGQLAAAEEEALAALELRRQFLGSNHELVASSLSTLAAVRISLGRLNESEPLLREALAVRHSLFPGDHSEVADSLNDLASLLMNRGELNGAEPFYRESLEMRQRLFPGDHPDVAQSLKSLALLYVAHGRLADAEPLLRDVLAMERRLFHGDHPAVAATMRHLAAVLQARGDQRGAESILREALEMMRRLFPGDHPNVAAGLTNLAAMLQARADLAGAEALFRESLDMFKRLFPGDHPNVAAGLSNLASLRQAGGDLAGAEPLLREALGMQRRVLGEEHPSTLLSLYKLADVLLASGRDAEASPLVEACIEGNTRTFGAAHRNTRRTIGLAVKLYESWDKADPGKGYDAKAAEWKAKLEALQQPAEAPAEKK